MIYDKTLILKIPIYVGMLSIKPVFNMLFGYKVLIFKIPAYGHAKYKTVFLKNTTI